VLSIPFFMPAVFAIAHTDLVLTVPRALAKMAVRQAKLQVVEAPRELKPFPYFMTWHPRLSNEPAHAWLRDQVRAVARSIRSK
jgi:DNA-binding transcriptional LysR family regulator